MRLLHTDELRFEEFSDDEIPSYAILSHRWNRKETSFQEFEANKYKFGPGFTKIRNACSVARNQRLEWIWIDTCCFDKRSSAELTEAINSMYQWYASAKICYAYLADVRWDGNDESESRRKFEASEWFTRGWTLQELLAPFELQFFDAEWNLIGTRTDFSASITAATKISQDHLLNPKTACVAVKFSWIAERKTSKIEDLAYCMLGLFDVNLPLMYGEGEKSFMRLQQEIIQKTDDESIFAWRRPPGSFSGHGMLATELSYFTDSGQVTRGYAHRSDMVKAYSITNRGLEIHVPHSLIVQVNRRRQEMTLRLACFDGDRRVVIALEHDHVKQRWFRVKCDGWCEEGGDRRGKGEVWDDAVRSWDEMRSIYVYQTGL